MDQVQVCWMIQGGPQCAFLPAGRNAEIEITLVPRDEMAVAQDENVWPATEFVRSGSDSEDSRILEGHVVCNRPQEDGERRDQDQTPEGLIP